MIRYSFDGSMRVTSFGLVTQSEGFWHGGRAIAENILIFGEEGSFDMQVGEERFSVLPGELLLIPGNTFYKPLDSKGCRYYFLHFYADTSEEEPRSARASVIDHAGISDPDFAYSISFGHSETVGLELHSKFRGSGTASKLRRLFERGAGLDPRLRFSDKLLLDALLRELLIVASDGDRVKYSKKLTLILDYIDRSYRLPISLLTLSREFGISRSYISRIFRSELGQKPSEYINNVRIAAARSLLTHSDASITQIAELTGFSDVYYFSRVFKSICGMSPTKFRGGGNRN